MLQYEIFLVLAPGSALIAISAFLTSVLRRKGRMFPSLSALLFCAAAILLLNECELLGPGEPSILFFSRLTYVFIAFCPVFWFLFAIEYTMGVRKAFRSLFVSLALVPVATSVISFTNPAHHLLWKVNEFRSIGNLTVNVVVRYGPWFWVHMIYSYALYLIGTVLIVKAGLPRQTIYRRQSLVSILGGLFPLAVNLVYVLRLLPGVSKDFTPIAIALSGALFSVGIVKFRLFDLTPPPREKFQDYIAEGIVILDERNRVLDINGLALDFLGLDDVDVIGRIFDSLIGASPANPVSALLRERGSFNLAPEGSERSIPLDLIAIPLKNGKTSFRGLCVAVREVPEAAARSLRTEPVFSARERRIADLIVAGHTNKEIATELFVSENTIKTHISHIFKKAGARNRNEFALMYRDRFDT